MAKKAIKKPDQRKTVLKLPPKPPVSTASLPLPVPTEPQSQPLDPAIPRWKRAFDSKSRKRVARILVYKMAGLKSPEIAKRLKTTPETIRHYLWLAGKNGWISPDGLELVDPSEDLAFSAAHKVVRNIHSALDGKRITDQQERVTIETAKGIGLFKTHQATKIEGAIQIPSLEVNIQMPAMASPLPPPSPDHMGGQGNYIEGAVNETNR